MMQGSVTKERGAALIVVLSLLTISLMVGLSSMQSSQIDERLAGNYKAATEAQMAAEYGAAFGIKADPDSFSSSGEACDTVAGSGLTEGDRLEWGWVDVDVPDEGLDYDLEARIVGCNDDDGDDRSSRYISWGRVVNSSGILVAERFLMFSRAGGGSSGGPPVEYDGPRVESPLTCAKDACGWDESDVGGYFDARPHPVPNDFVCNGDSCRTSPDPDAEEGEKFGYEEDGWSEYVESLSFDDSYEGGSGKSVSLEQGERGKWKVIEVLPAGAVASSGNTNTHGVILVRDGATLVGSGTGHHEGLIIIEEGGSVEFGNNFNVYGAVVALGKVTVSVGNGGKGGVRYSDFFEGSGSIVWQPL